MISCRYLWKKSDGLKRALQLSLFCMMSCVVVSADTQQTQMHINKTILDFNEAGDDGASVVSAGPHANQLHLAPDR